MELSDAFAEGTGIVEFFTKVIPAIHESRPGEFAALFEIPIIICVKFDDGQVFSIAISDEKIRVEDDEMIDFPLLTIFGKIEHWNVFLEYSRRYASAYDERKDQISKVFYFTSSFLADLEKFDLVVELGIYDEGVLSLDAKIVLNNYEADPSFKEIHVSLEKETMDNLAKGEKNPEEVASSLSIKGAVLKGAELGRVFLKHRP